MNLKTKSLLINYSGYPTSPNAFLPDNGLAALANSLLQQGHNTTIHDYNTLNIMKLLPHEIGEELAEIRKKSDEKDNLDKIKKIYNRLNEIQKEDISSKADHISGLITSEGINFLGFKLWTGKSFENSIALATEIKKRNPKIPIFAGGPHVDYFRGKIYGVTNIFDVLVYGEGEETIVHLADYTQGKTSLYKIPNIVFNNGRNIVETPIKRFENLNQSFPIYDKDVYPSLFGNEKIKMFITEFSRGCPSKCNFCGHSNKSGEKWRAKDASRIIEELEYVINAHGTKVFRNGDSNTPGFLINDVANQITSRGLDIEYALLSHVNNIKPEYLSKLKDSGCFSLFFGIESGNQHILDTYINKGLNLEYAKSVIEKAKNSGLFVVTSFVYPSPGDTDSTKNDTLEFILHARPDSVNLCTPIVAPRTPWGDKPEKYGIALSNNYFDELMSFTPALFFPPSMWKPLNYKINGQTFFEMVKESELLGKKIEANGLLTQVMDDAALMAKYAEMDYKQFRDDVRRHLVVGNYEKMSSVISKINQNAVNGLK